ncbi:Crotonase-like protein [Dichotomopilus funicola]|uniref:Crotonase-like protein n=1 Tax=Dichotomopilus funicola TaxID=1934379 RepID=A0AAN6VB29_9PEZI|nr:Crotonase-like protein [Dichotomopilus funicola]
MSRPTVHHDHFIVSYPQEHVVQVTINRPDKLNCINQATSRQIAQVWDDLDADPTLWVGIITGRGRAFCTGADLHEWNTLHTTSQTNPMTAPGLAGLPRRTGTKPILAAVNGLCLGGGFEMVSNCDIVLASSAAVFALPEVQRGIAPVAGCMPRLARTLGLQRTMELVLTGRKVDARTMGAWGLVSRVVDEPDNSKSHTGKEGGNGGNGESAVVDAALELARDICRNSPDALIVGRVGVRMAWEDGDVEAAVTKLETEWYPRLVRGANFGEGIRAFVEKRPPRWLDPKL